MIVYFFVVVFEDCGIFVVVKVSFGFFEGVVFEVIDIGFLR